MNSGVSRRAILTGLASAAIAATGCAPQQAEKPAPSPSESVTSTTPSPSTPSPTVSSVPPEPSETPTSEAPSTPDASAEATETASSGEAVVPTPAGSSTTLLPGSSHSEAASAYAYEAADVQRWIHTPGKGPQPANKTVFLTFDDGPNHQITPKIMDTMKQKGVHGTFFVVGQYIHHAPDMLHRAVSEGHSVVIHSYSHDYKYLYPGRKGNVNHIMSDYDKALAEAKKVLGNDYSHQAYRYPGGHMSWKNLAPADKALAERGVHWIDWNALTGDAEPKKRRPTTVDGMVKMATSGIRQGLKVVVLLAHDANGKNLTAQSLPRVIDAYQKAGYDFGIIK